MQTFLPYPQFYESAHALDNKRLGKQRVECLQILRALTNKKYGWQNHPAVNMWRGHEGALLTYTHVIIDIWRARGFKDTCKAKVHKEFPYERFTEEQYIYPPWLGNEAFHLSHQSNLIRKFPEHYRKIFGPDVPDNLPYVWPTK